MNKSQNKYDGMKSTEEAISSFNGVLKGMPSTEDYLQPKKHEYKVGEFFYLFHNHIYWLDYSISSKKEKNLIHKHCVLGSMDRGDGSERIIITECPFIDAGGVEREYGEDMLNLLAGSTIEEARDKMHKLVSISIAADEY